MYRFLKVLHLVGLALFLGSILSHIVAGKIGGPIGGPDFLSSRMQIVAATQALTMPGLGLAVLSGLALVARSRIRQPWMAVHAGLAGIIIVLAAFVIIPAGHAALSGAFALADGRGDMDSIVAALNTERLAGAVNILLALAVVGLGVYKPAIRMRSRTSNPAEQGRT